MKKKNSPRHLLNTRIYSSRKKSPKNRTNNTFKGKQYSRQSNPVLDYFNRKSPPRKIVKISQNYNGFNTKSQKKQTSHATTNIKQTPANLSKKKQQDSYNYQQLLKRRDYLLKKKTRNS